MISIVIPTLNQPHFAECLEALVQHTKLQYELVLVYDSEDIRQRKAFENTHGVYATVVTNGERIGVPAALNQGIFFSSGEQVLLMNDDVLVRSGWLEPLVDTLARHPQFGIACATSVGNDGSTGPIGIGGCSLHTHESLQNIGHFSTAQEFFNHGCDFDYYCRALEAGYNPVRVEEALVQHKGGTTVHTGGQQEIAIINKILERYNYIPQLLNKDVYVPYSLGREV